jgi:predicted transcriptional regulator
MEPLTKNDLIEVLETSALAQLRALRSLRRAEQRPAAPPGTKRKSNMDVVYDILLAAKSPLHITDILQRAQKNYHRPLRRESLVSALTKKVLDRNTFTRTAPNTFDLLKRLP